MKRILLSAFAVALALGPSQAAAPKAQTFRGEYSISFLGFPVAKSEFASTLKGDSFKVKGSLTSAGIGTIFDSTRASMSVSGTFSGETTRPDDFRVSYTSGSKAKKTSIRFRKGNVARTLNDPPLRKRGGDWVRVTADDLRAVADPLSSTLLRAYRDDEVCGRTVKIFDGEMRANLVLSHVSTDPVAFPGFEGNAVTCRARFVPVAGYRKGKRAIEFLAKQSNITIAFAELGQTNVYAPVRASVGTEIGPITIRARRLEISQ